MDVRCERCSTEYEFDDALVSGRGTTVKCTNCGHKFKIRRRDGDYSEDFWNVRTGDGKTLVFTSLRELQRGIQTQLVDRSDMLSRGGLPPKPIGQIPELSPFFDPKHPRPQTPPPPPPPPLSRRPSRPPPPPGAAAPVLTAPPRQRFNTHIEFPPPPAVPTGTEETPRAPALEATPPPSDPADAPPESDAASTERLGRPAALPPTPGRSTSRPPPAPTPVAVPPDVVITPAVPVPIMTPRVPPALTPTPAVLVPEPVPLPPPVAPVPEFDVAAARTAAAPPFEVSSPLPPTPALRMQVMDGDDFSESAQRSTLAPVSRRRSVGGLVVAGFVVGSVLLLGAVWARENLGGKLGGTKPGATTTMDPRASAFLANGDRALAEGNLDVAKENFDKASALADKDPRVLLGAARLAAARADVLWLKSRLLAPNATAEHRATRDELAQLAGDARSAAEVASAASPEDPATIRAKIDALRISGEREAARGLVSKVNAAVPTPDAAYVLAALDLAEAEPLWSTVIERLRVAASAEPGPGRARAALVYALARSGDAASARAELDRLAVMPRQHPLMALLRAQVERAPTGPLQPSGKSSASASGSGAPDASAPDKKPSGDPRQLVAQAEGARQRGELEKARLLYSAALDRNPNDTEALHGLAAIAHAQHDLNGARSSYKRVLSLNPNYVPALVGAADVDWESGDRASAMRAYKEIVDRFPEGTYPTRVKQRVEAAAPPAPTTEPGVENP